MYHRKEKRNELSDGRGCSCPSESRCRLGVPGRDADQAKATRGVFRTRVRVSAVYNSARELEIKQQTRRKKRGGKRACQIRESTRTTKRPRLTLPLVGRKTSRLTRGPRKARWELKDATDVRHQNSLSRGKWALFETERALNNKEISSGDKERAERKTRRVGKGGVLRTRGDKGILPESGKERETHHLRLLKRRAVDGGEDQRKEGAREGGGKGQDLNEMKE